MNARTRTDAAIVRPVRKPTASLSLVCLGFCGGGTSAFRNWEERLNQDTELVLICYPGREGRFSEEHATDWEELATNTTQAVIAAVDRPYVLFGHSMGGWMAFDVAARIERAGLPVPELVVVSSCNAPDRGVTERDRFLSNENSDAELLAWMRASGQAPEHVLDDEDLTEMAVRLMRADVRVRDSYRYTAHGGTRLPVHVLYGVQDGVIEDGAEERWRGVCHGEFTMTALPGGHFFDSDIWDSLPDYFGTVTTVLLAGPVSLSENGVKVPQSHTKLSQRPAALDVVVEAGCPATVDASAVRSMWEGVSWLSGVGSEVRAVLDEYGALFIRGLPVRNERDFADVRDVILRERASYREKATPRTDFGDDIYSSTDLPPAQSIRMHNENSYTLSFPGILIFGCLTAPEAGGATPVADCRKVLKELSPELVRRFRRTGWKLLRNYGGNMSLGWRTAFGTDSVLTVERYCAEQLISCRWGADGESLHTEQVRSAIAYHPRTGEQVWFNHVAFWNEWSLEEDIREVLVDELGHDGLPFNTTYGDGTTITPEEVAQMNHAYDTATVRRRWRPGDVMIVDNLLTAHGRDPFTGDRRIVVAMGEPITLADCRPTLAPTPGGP